MEFIKKNKKTIGLTITFIVGGLGAIGYGVPEPLVAMIRSALGV